MVSCPLLTPLTFLCAATPFGRAAKREKRGLGSVRLSAYGWLLCPEFTLRSSPRITVRGQTVQGVCFPLRKAPLPSSVDPWSTKRHCGPLAFRRATEGSRVLRKGWGVKRGRETLVSLPLLPPPPGGGNARPAHRQPISPAAASRRNGGTAHPLLRVKAMGRKVGCAASAADGKERGRACRYSKNLKVSPSALGFSAENPSFFSQDCSGFSPPEALK